MSDKVVWVLRDLSTGDYLMFVKPRTGPVYHWCLRNAMEFQSKQEALEYAHESNLEHLVALDCPQDYISGGRYYHL